MNYRVVIFKTPCDIPLAFPASEALEDTIAKYQAGVDQVVPTELAAADLLREHRPDALAFPASIKLGSGAVTMIVAVADIEAHAAVGTQRTLPLVALVRAIPEHDVERKKIARDQHLTRAPWQIRPVKPSLLESTTAPIELRSTEVDHPVGTAATIGIDHHGKLVIHVEIAGTAFSLQFRDHDIHMGCDGSFRYPRAK